MRVTDAVFERGESVRIDVAVCGYEARSTYVPSVVTTRSALRLAVDYDSPGVGSYDRNRRSLIEGGWSLVTEAQLLDRLGEIGHVDDVDVRVDLSSMRRSTVAALVELLSGSPGTAAQFVYAPARYDPAGWTKSSESMVLTAGPISPYFAGALRQSSLPLGLVVGLGLEPHRVLGVAELLEPSQIWAFMAESDDPEMNTAVREVHRSIVGDRNTRLQSYDLRSPADTYSALESLVFAASQEYRLVLAPSGPKIFALMCLLAAAPRVSVRPAVWRVGSRLTVEPAEVEAIGDVVAVNVTF